MSDQPSEPVARPALAARYRATRDRSERLCAPLEPDDYQLQSMPECSPPKWHLAHTSWFFEAFILAPHAPNFRPHHPRYNFLFNSYYESVGERWPRPARGLLSRPTVAEVYAYRHAVDEKISTFLDGPTPAAVAPLLELGVNHEATRQDLLLRDVKHDFGRN